MGRRARMLLACAVVVSASALMMAASSAGDGRRQGGRQGSATGAARGAALKPLTDAASLAQGRAVYEGTTGLCLNCHRQDLGGLVGPNLVDDYWANGCSVTDIIAATEKGFPDRGMMPFGSGKPLTATQLHQVASYILSKRGSAPPGAKAHDPAREKLCK